MEPDKLLIVAHPDDELLWGGANLLREPGWHVVCATHAEDPVRKLEFHKTMSYLSVFKAEMFDVRDEYTEDSAVADRLFDNTPFESALQTLSQKQWKIVLTHNEEGEYGHEHHKKVHRMVMRYFPQAKTFSIAAPLNPELMEVKRACTVFYSNTQTICRKLFLNEDSTLRPIEAEHIFKEQLYVPRVPSIPKVIHQIWFGSPLDTNTPRGHLMTMVKAVAERNGYVYKLWTDAERNEISLPITHEYIQKALAQGTNRWAQVADLARYEILHRYGGVYLDSLFEIGDAFCKYIQDHGTSHDIICANEDPCGLECKGRWGWNYMSNGFFACIPGCVVLKRLLHPETLNEIDFSIKYINRTTGPYYFRLGMIPEKDKIHVIDTEKIYPFMVNESGYRKAQPNQCLTAERTIIQNCLTTKYPNSLAVYYSGLGGSWSW